MSESKIRQPRAGQPKPPLTQLKELPPAQRGKIMEILRSHSYRDAEPMVSRAVGFRCSIYALCRFSSWQRAQEDMEISDDMLRQVVSFTRKRHADWPEEKIRAAAASFFTLRSMAKRNEKVFTSIARLHLQAERCRIKERKLELEKLKFEESLRCKEEAGWDALVKAFEKNPQAMELFQQASKLIRQSGSN
jgi:hypothetical protein